MYIPSEKCSYILCRPEYLLMDAMEVKNKVEFSRSAVNKKTEQEIVEGVLGNNENETTKEGTEVFETDISTEPVTINVKPFLKKINQLF